MFNKYTGNARPYTMKNTGPLPGRSRKPPEAMNAEGIFYLDAVVASRAPRKIDCRGGRERAGEPRGFFGGDERPPHRAMRELGDSNGRERTARPDATAGNAGRGAIGEKPALLNRKAAADKKARAVGEAPLSRSPARRGGARPTGAGKAQEGRGPPKPTSTGRGSPCAGRGVRPRLPGTGK